MTKTELFTCSVYAYYIIIHPKLLSTWLRLYELEESWQKNACGFLTDTELFGYAPICF